MGNKHSNAKAERDLRNAVTFVGDQLKHPAVRQFVGDAAEIMATSNGNPEEMAMRLGQRAGEEQNRIINRTLDHYTGHETPGDKSMPPALNALTFV
jgi:siroheme synthase